MVPHGAPAPNRHCCRETLSKTLDINAGQSMATLRPIKAAGLLRVWPMEGTGGKDVFKCPAPPSALSVPSLCATAPYCEAMAVRPQGHWKRRGKKAHRGALYSARLERSIAPSSSALKTNIRRKRYSLSLSPPSLFKDPT